MLRWAKIRALLMQVFRVFRVCGQHTQGKNLSPPKNLALKEKCGERKNPAKTNEQD